MKGIKQFQSIFQKENMIDSVSEVNREAVEEGYHKFLALNS